MWNFPPGRRGPHSDTPVYQDLSASGRGSRPSSPSSETWPPVIVSDAANTDPTAIYSAHFALAGTYGYLSKGTNHDNTSQHYGGGRSADSVRPGRRVSQRLVLVHRLA